MNAIYEFGQYFQRNAIVWAIVRFVSSNISCSSDLVLKLGLQNDEKQSRFCKRNTMNNVSHVVFRMASNYEGDVSRYSP